MRILNILSYLGALALSIGCFVMAINGYDEYIAGYFPLHLVVFGLPIIITTLVILHAYGEATGWKNGWERRIFRRRK